jgi:hypothetical protein
MTEYDKDIEMALNADVELSEKEYAEKCAMMDESTKQHGVEGKAPLSEAKRHKRIQTNYYATSMNILINMYQVLAEIAADLKELKNNGGNGKNE